MKNLKVYMFVLSYLLLFGCGGGGGNNQSSLQVTIKKVPLAAGGGFSVRLKPDGSVWTCGENSYGELGIGTLNSGVSTPVPVPGLTGVAAVAAGSSHVIALKEDGTVWTWGNNASGQLGYSSDPAIGRPTPARVGGLPSIIAVATRNAHSIALSSDGTVWTWGRNDYWQLGYESHTIDNSTPRQVPGLTDIVAIAGGGQHTIALKEDGTVWGWGDNMNGQLGTTAVNGVTFTPVKAQTLEGIVAIAAGTAHSIALKNDGTVWTWGRNTEGQLGNGVVVIDNSNYYNPVPAQIQGVAMVSEIGAGAFFSSLLKSDGTVWTWGSNRFGQIGIGTTSTTGISTPTQLPGLTGAGSIAGGGAHSIIQKSDGTVWAWGNNESGQLGDGSTTLHTSVVRFQDM